MHAFRDDLAHAPQWDHLGGGMRRRSRALHVGLRDPARRTRADHGGEVDAELLRHLTGDWCRSNRPRRSLRSPFAGHVRGDDAAPGSGAAHVRELDVELARQASRVRRRDDACGRAVPETPGRDLPIREDDSDDRAHGMGLSHPGTVVKGAGDLRGDVGVELVGAEDEHDLVTLDSGSVGDRPLDDRALLHGHAELGDDHVGRHGGRLLLPDQRAYLGGNASRVGDVGLLEHRAERHRAERRAQAGDRSIEIVEPVLGDLRRELGADAAEADRFLHHERSVRAGATDSSTVGRSKGCKVRGSTTSTEIPSASSAVAASSASVTMRPCATIVTSVPGRTTAATPSGTSYGSAGTSAVAPSRNLFRTKITGSSSRTDAISSPLASYALDGMTTLRPGMWHTSASRLWLCWAASWCRRRLP